MEETAALGCVVEIGRAYILWGARSLKKAEVFYSLLRDVSAGSRGCGLKLKLFFKPKT